MRRTPSGKTIVFCEVDGHIREIGCYRHAWVARRKLRQLKDLGVNAWLKPEMNIVFEDK